MRYIHVRSRERHYDVMADLTEWDNHNVVDKRREERPASSYYYKSGHQVPVEAIISHKN